MQKREIMYDHLLDNGITRNYVRWLMHEEYEFFEPINTSTNESNKHDEMQEMLNDSFECQCQMRNLKEVHMFMMSLKNQIRMQTNFIIC